MKSCKRLFFLIPLLAGFFVVHSQAPENGNELDRQYAPNPSSIFNNTQKKSYESYDNSTSIKNVIKFSPTLLLRQRAALFYEREMFRGVSANIGIGKPFGNDIFQNAFFSLGSVFNYSSSLSPGDVVGNGTYWGSYPSLSLGLKVYFLGETFDETYMEFNYRWERVDYLLDASVGGTRVDGENDVAFKMNGFNMGFGYTGLTGSNKNFTHEIYCNFGFKLFKYTTFDRVNVKSVTGGTETVYRKTGDESSGRILPSLNMGYIFGFGF